MSPTKNSQKLAKTFYCEMCDYICYRSNDIDKHLLTRKHKILQNPTKKLAENNTFCCDCGKKYKHSSTLYAHKKTCIKTNLHEKNNDELMLLLIKENQEIKNMMVDVIKKCGQNSITNINTTNTNNTNNSHNKTFNLQFFLNETCKDAMNITEFVDSIKLQLTDLEKVGDIGFVEGISNIIVENLHSLDESKRPVHCTDFKREVMYVKDEDKWEKENENKQKIRKVIKKIAQKNTQLLTDFKAVYPDCATSESKQSDKYSKLVIEAMGGDGDNDLEKENKIIRNIAKEVIIEK